MYMSFLNIQAFPSPNVHLTSVLPAPLANLSFVTKATTYFH